MVLVVDYNAPYQEEDIDQVNSTTTAPKSPSALMKELKSMPPAASSESPLVDLQSPPFLLPFLMASLFVRIKTSTGPITLKGYKAISRKQVSIEGDVNDL